MAIWPEDISSRINSVLGADIMEPPLSFNRTKRGVSYFRLSCGHEQRMKAVQKVLDDAGLHAGFFLDTYFDKPLTANSGVLSIRIPEAMAEQFAATIANNAEKIKAALQQDIVESEPKNFTFPSRPIVLSYRDFFGRPISSRPTYVPEITALIAHKLDGKNDLGALPKDLLYWLIPPQDPAALMFSIDQDTQKFTIAEGKNRENLVALYQACVAKREALIGNSDHMFDPIKGEIVELPAGTIHAKLAARDYSGLAAATYWNPDESSHYILDPSQLAKIKLISRNVAIPNAAAPQ